MKTKIRIRRIDGYSQRYVVGRRNRKKTLAQQLKEEYAQEQKEINAAKAKKYRPKMTKVEKMAKQKELFIKRPKKLMVRIGDNANMRDFEAVVAPHDQRGFPKHPKVKNKRDLIKIGIKTVKKWNDDVYSWNQPITEADVVITSDKGYPVDKVKVKKRKKNMLGIDLSELENFPG